MAPTERVPAPRLLTAEEPASEVTVSVRPDATCQIWSAVAVSEATRRSRAAANMSIPRPPTEKVPVAAVTSTRELPVVTRRPRTETLPPSATAPAWAKVLLKRRRSPEAGAVPPQEAASLRAEVLSDLVLRAMEALVATPARPRL